MREQEREFMGYNLFNHVDNEKIRTWNRAITFLTVYKDAGKEPATQYLKQFDMVSRKQIKDLFNESKEKGLDAVHKEASDSKYES